jgi:site-specific recombinase XerD
MMRHSHATWSARNGADVFAIQATLGHARLETSQLYIALTQGLEKGTFGSLPQLD